jgi:hypothetical protein
MATKKTSDTVKSDSPLVTDDIRSYVASNPKIKALHFDEAGNYYLYPHDEMEVVDKRNVPTGRVVANGGKVVLVETITREEILQA